ncbi:hypothetical protein [Paracoccus fontiphilus]|uniref:Uncharacterized protein n=2 Tax=Paracoccus fontiphilus TaxID=1815556 RepID=A0ABV7I9A7_9RHOB|nr:hypothetical protein [Paracoccus fontiphilus]
MQPARGEPAQPAQPAQPSLAVQEALRIENASGVIFDFSESALQASAASMANPVAAEERTDNAAVVPASSSPVPPAPVAAPAAVASAPLSAPAPAGKAEVAPEAAAPSFLPQQAVDPDEEARARAQAIQAQASSRMLDVVESLKTASRDEQAQKASAENGAQARVPAARPEGMAAA